MDIKVSELIKYKPDEIDEYLREIQKDLTLSLIHI